MSAYVASVTGDSNNPATFGGAGVPGDDDTIILANDVTLTVPAGVTLIIGTSPDNDTSTPAIACSSSTGTGKLIVNGTLIYRGTVSYGNAIWEFGPGSVVTHDSSQATTPSATLYSFTTLNGNTNAYLKFNGTSGSHVTWNIASGSGQAGRIGNKNANLTNGLMQGTYVDFSDIYGTSNIAFCVALKNAGAIFDLQHVTLTRCGQFYLADISSTSTFIVDYWNVQSPILNSGNAYRTFYLMAGTFAAKVSGTRQFTNVYCPDGIVGLPSGGTNGEATGLVFKNNFLWTNSYTGGPSGPFKAYGGKFRSIAENDWENNFLGNYTTSGSSTYPSHLPGGVLNRTYTWYGSYDPTHTMNYHNFYMQGIETALDGWIFDIDYGGNANNSIIQGNGATSTYIDHNFDHSVKNSIFLAGADGKARSAPYNYSGMTPSDGVNVFCPLVTFENNTVAADSTAGDLSFCGVAGEGINAQVGEYKSVQDNIFFAVTSQQGCIMGFTHPFSDSVIAADYNWQYNLTGTLYYDQADGTYQNTPGANDTVADPQFVDSSRNFIKFCQQFDASVTTYSDALAKFSTWGTDGHDSRYDISDLIDYVTAGFVPTNSATATAGHTGGQVGAVAYVSGGTTYEETLYDTATTSVSLTAIASRVESLLSTIQATDTVSDAIAAVETLLTSATGTGSVIDDLFSSVSEIITDSITVQASVSDIVNSIESLQSVAQSTGSVADVAIRVESLITTIQTLATVTDTLLSGAVENILDTASVSASATDVQTMVDSVLIMVQSGASAAAVASYIDQVLTTATATSSVIDAIVGAFIGKYIRGHQVYQRSFEQQVYQRSFSHEVNQL